MSKKVIFFFVTFIFFSGVHLAFASLTINEIMYDLSGADSTNGKSREWIEIYNGDASAVSIDATKWRIYDGGANRTINDQVNFSIPAGAYVIFAGDKDTFLSDNPGFSGVVYDTGITSLNNTNATLKLLDQNGSAVDSVTYDSSQGGAGDGNSLQKISGSWAGATPTPGAANTSASSSSSGSAASDSGTTGQPVRVSYDNSSSSNSSSGAASNQAQNKKIKTTITARNYSLVGIPLSFQADAFGRDGEALHEGRYFWNFGDGDSKDIKINSTGDEPITHTYMYSGDYTVTLEYYQNYYADVPDATDKIVIDVVPADIAISSVGNEQDFFVELTNNTIYTADIGSWVLTGAAKNFVLPKDTELGSKKKLIISSKITGFTMADKDSLKLMTPQGQVTSSYIPDTKVVQVATSETVPPTKEKNVLADKVIVPAKAVDDPLPVQIPANTLEASVVESDPVKSNSKSSSVPLFITFGLIGASAGAVYFIRAKKVIPKLGDDFKILDE